MDEKCVCGHAYDEHGSDDPSLHDSTECGVTGCGCICFEGADDEED